MEIQLEVNQGQNQNPLANIVGLNSNKTPYFVDASSLKNSSCFRYFWWNTIDGWKSNTDLVNLRFAYGSGVHKYLEGSYCGLSFKDSANMAMDYYEPFNKHADLTNVFEFRTTVNLLKVCDAYNRRFRMEDNLEFDFIPHKHEVTGKPLVEHKFCILIWENEKYQLFLAGTIDLVCSYAGYPLLLVDHKTSSTRADKSDEYFKGYDWDIQTMLYSKVWREARGLSEYPPVMINGIFVKKPTKKAAESGTFDGVEFHRSNIIEYSEEKMGEFTQWLNGRLGAIIHYLSTPSLIPDDNYDMSACRMTCGNGGYFSVCKLPREYQKSTLESSFTQIKYNPLKFRD